MKNILTNACLVITSFFMASLLYSCGGNQSSSSATRCSDSTAGAAKSTTTTTDTSTAAMVAGSNANATTSGESGARANERMKAAPAAPTEQSTEPTGPVRLNVSSPAFGAGNVIPVKYTCDGQGATPPINVGNIPPGSISLAMIVHDYEASPTGGFTYWLIWNLDTTNIPENFVNNHEGMNAARQYGYTPICAKSGDHRYHFIVYALNTKLVLPKTTTKQGLESVMRGHILGKGEVVGVYNKHLE